jgi:adenine-specific DNA-methyltransferase
LIDLRLGDCLEVMPTIPSGSVDLILADPPYFRIADEAWDRQWDDPAAYLAWLGRVADEWRRVLKPNGSLYVFASPRMAARVECLIAERFSVINSIVWRKDAPSSALRYGTEHFRGFVEMSERIIFAEHHSADDVAGDATGWSDAFDRARRETFGRYLEGEIERSGVSRKELAGLFPSKTGGMTGCVSNWVLGLNVPTPEQYERMRSYLNRQGGDFLVREHVFLRREYEELCREHEHLRQQYEELRRPFNLKPNAPFADVWDFSPPRDRRHPCQKPLSLLKHVIETSTRPDDVVLDSFAGSCSTLVACLKTGRQGIGIEIDPDYIEIGQRWLAAAETPLFESLPSSKDSTPCDPRPALLFS